MTAKDQATLRTELLGDVGAPRTDAQATQSTVSIADFLRCLRDFSGARLSLAEIEEVARQGWAGQQGEAVTDTRHP
jgi:hypothetical protein